jgi:hypothetical protein
MTMNQTYHVAESPHNICPLLVGSEIPRLTMTTVQGHSLDLRLAVTEKPTILVYYRGGW